MSSESTKEVHQETENPTRAPLSDAEKAELKAIVEKGRGQSLQDSLGALWRLGRLDDAVVELAAFQCGYWAPATHKWPTYRGHNIHYVSSLGAAAALADGVEGVEADPEASLKEKLLHTGMYIVPSILRSDAAHKYGHGEWIRCEKDKGTVTEAEVSESRVLVLDVDVAPLGGSREANTTQAEWSVSLHRAWLIRRWLLSLGCPEHALGFTNSGNGAHLVLALSGEFSKDVKDLRVRLLHAAAQVWDMERAGSVYIVDPSLADGARYIPLYGTKKRKAAHHKERPQRRTWLVAPDTVDALDIEAFRTLVEGAEADVTDEERSAYEALQARHKPKQAAQKKAPPVQPAAASSTPAFGKSTKLTECDRVPVSQVLGALGEDVEHPTCLWCGRNDKTFVLQDEDHNGVKCHHANSCGQKVKGPVSLVAKAVANVDSLKGDKEGTKKVLHWFAEKGFIVLEKRSKKKSRKAPKAAAPAAEGEAVDQTPEEWTADERPVVQISPDEMVMNDQAIEALSKANSGLFQRGRALVKVTEGEIHPIAHPTLREVLSSVIRWEAWAGKEEGYVHTSPPSPAVSAVYCRGEWGLPPIRGVVEGPCLRADGSVITRPGYDAESGVYVRGNVSVDVPERPTRDQALAAWAKLEDVLVDFPFAEEMDKAAALSLLLTPGVRATLAGPAPFQLIRANTPGTGKDLFAKVVSVIWTGAETAATPPVKGNPDETRKRLTTLLQPGRPFALFDDLRYWGDDAWASLLTTNIWNDRLLGESKDVHIPVVTTFIGTGNNTQVIGDCIRRVIVTLMESPFEDPENRPLSSFVHKDRAFRLVSYVHEHRAELLAACLTILRAHAVAGYPDHPRWGSYEEWARVVAGAVTWLGLPNPCKSAQRLAGDGSTDVSQLRDLFAAWDECLGDTPVSAAEILKACKDSTEVDDPQARLTDAVLQWCGIRDGKLPSTITLGKRLTAAATRPAGGRRVRSTMSRTNTRTWVLENLSPATIGENEQNSGGVQGMQGIAENLSPAPLTAKKGCNVAVAGDAGDSFKSKEDFETLHVERVGQADPDWDSTHDATHSRSVVDPGSIPCIPCTRAEVAEMIEEKMQGIAQNLSPAHPLLSPAHPLHGVSPAHPLHHAGDTGSIPAIPAPIPFEQVVASQAAAQAAAQAQAEREAIARQYLSWVNNARQLQRTPPPPPEFPEDVGGTPTPEQLDYRQRLRSTAQICANLERMYGNG